MPKNTTTIQGTPVTTPAPTGVPRKQQIADLITHLAKDDNHLFQALSSLQSQVNSVVGSITDWTSWDANVYDSVGYSLSTDEFSSYYMTAGNLLFIEAHGAVTIHTQRWTGGTEALPTFTQVTSIGMDLPVDIGETILKTPTVYLTEYNGPATVGVLGVEAQKRLVVMILNRAILPIPPGSGPPSARDPTIVCRLMVGGPLGIIQGS